jgi:hypothetical protein
VPVKDGRTADIYCLGDDVKCAGAGVALSRSHRMLLLRFYLALVARVEKSRSGRPFSTKRVGTELAVLSTVGGEVYFHSFRSLHYSVFGVNR